MRSLGLDSVEPAPARPATALKEPAARTNFLKMRIQPGCPSYEKQKVLRNKDRLTFGEGGIKPELIYIVLYIL